jgi:hypothetical protein
MKIPTNETISETTRRLLESDAVLTNQDRDKIVSLYNAALRAGTLTKEDRDAIASIFLRDSDRLSEAIGEYFRAGR